MNPQAGPFLTRIIRYTSVGSTNDLAIRAAEGGADEGTVIVADEQTAGRGRLGRTWASPPGAGLYVSVVLRPSARAARLITIAAGVAIADGIEAATGLPVAVKWPNDLQVGPKKVAGILAERVAGTGGEAIVLGFGINLMPAAYPPEVAARATSLEGELGRALDGELVLTECLAALGSRYGQLQQGADAPVLEAWRRRAASTLRRRVEWDTEGVTRSGVAEDIDEGGALVIRTPAGTERVISGEVRWL